MVVFAGAFIAIIGMRGAEEGVVAVVGDIVIAISDSERATRIVVGSGISDGSTHPGVEVLVEAQVVPVGLRADVMLRTDGLQAIIVRVLKRRGVTKIDALERMTCLILVDGRDDTVEVMLPAQYSCARVSASWQAENGVS